MKRIRLPQLIRVVTILCLSGVFIGQSSPVRAEDGIQLWLDDGCLYYLSLSSMSLTQNLGCDPATYHRLDPMSPTCYEHWNGSAWLAAGCIQMSQGIGAGDPIFLVGYTSGHWLQFSFSELTWSYYYNPIITYSDGSILVDTEVRSDTHVYWGGRWWEYNTYCIASQECESWTVSMGGGPIVPQLYCTDSAGNTSACAAPATGYGACMMLNDSGRDWDLDGVVGVTELSGYCSGR